MNNPQKVVLAYSGGLDTSVIIPWLKETYGCRVVAVVADVGQDEDFPAIRQKALSSGAEAAYVVDVKAEFATGFLFPALRANAVYEGEYLLGTALAPPRWPTAAQAREMTRSALSSPIRRSPRSCR